MQLRPIKARRLYQGVLERIRELMDGGVLKPGDKLMPERELALRLGVSRSSVREAIRTLEVMGAVSTRPGGGTFVRDTTADEIIQPLAMFMAVEQSSLLDMFEVRRVLESATARLAAERASAEEAARIRQALRGMEQSFNLRDSEKGEGYDVEFHQVVAEATHNALLIRLFRTLSEELSRVVSAARRQLYTGPDDARRIIEHHREICGAIEQRDAERAERAMLEHLTYAERHFRKKLGGRGKGRAG
jgi:GntR family transcriptional repressor for pyruvate dehydrogenase complex